MEELIQEKVSQKENELNATYDEKMRNYEARYVTCYLSSILHALSETYCDQGAGPPGPTHSRQESTSRSSRVS